MEFLPPYYVITVVAILGLIIGSFLDVIVCRYHTGKSINGRSHCMSCGHTLSWYELFPFASYVILRGKCKHCGGHIPVRLLFMELLTASLFVYAYLHVGLTLLLPFSFALLAYLIVIAVYDMRHMVIPNEFVIGLFAFAAVYLGYEVYVTSSWMTLLPHIAGAVASSLFYGSLWVISKGRWIGLGDAKLAFPLCMMLTLPEAFSFVVFSFWIGAFISVVILGVQKVLQSGKHHLRILSAPLTMKSEVPFAPFMILAFVIVFFQHHNVLSLMSSFF